jgi:hypothetical protein
MLSRCRSLRAWPSAFSRSAPPPNIRSNTARGLVSFVIAVASFRHEMLLE